MLRRVRQVVQAIGLAVFFTLLLLTRYDGNDRIGYPVGVFLQFDPLGQLGTWVATRAVPSALFAPLTVLLLSLVLGRSFCGWLCPLGALNQLAGRWRRRAVASQRAVHRYHPAQRVKYGILVGALFAAALGLQWIGLLDPIALTIRSFALSLGPLGEWAVRGFFDGLYRLDWSSISDVSEAAYDLLRRSVLSFREPVFRQADLIGLLALAVLSLNLYRPRFWCRFVCPLGALLGATARFSALRLSHAGECDRCGRCAARCPGGADPAEASAGKWRPAECYVCGNCTSTCAKGLRFSFHAPPLIGKSTPVAGLDVGRRTLLTGAVTGVIAAPLIRLPRIKQLPEPLLIRPPGALAENDFLTRCIRCGECMKVCLTAGLQPSLWEAGAEGLWTPVLIPRMGYCEYNCTLCGQVCPTGAITKLSLFAKHSLKIGTAFIDPGRCIPLTYGLDCLVCEEHCPTSPKAIEMVEVEVVAIGGARKRVRRPVIDPKRCVGCGVCEARCPVRDLPAIRVSSLGESRTPSRA